MKTLIHTFVLVFLLTNLDAQFAPEGATWHYGQGYPFSGDIGYMTIRAEGDTLIQGITCQKIRTNNAVYCLDRPLIEFTHQENDIVYYYNFHYEEFQVLYDFSAGPGDIWHVYTYDNSLDLEDTITVLVESVEWININGSLLKKLSVLYQYDFQEYNWAYATNQTIIEQLGDTHYMFDFHIASYNWCDSDYSKGLRCYEDSILGLYETGTAESCTYSHIWISLSEINTNDLINIYPNPAHSLIKIESKSGLVPKNYILRDFTGKIIHKDRIENDEIRLDHLINGLYLLEFYSDDAKLLSLNKLIKI